MPIFRTAGVVNIHFVHEIEANSAEDAENKVCNTRLDGLDNYSMNDGETSVHTVIELDEDGNEIDDEG